MVRAYLRKGAALVIAALAIAGCSSFELPDFGRETPTPTRTPVPSLPRATPTAPPAAEEHVHIVVAGETLAQIALQYGTTVRELAETNGIANPERIFVGQVIVVPGGGEGTLVLCDTASLVAAARDAAERLERDLAAGSVHYPAYLSLVDYLSLRASEELDDGQAAARAELERSLAQLSIALSRLNAGHIAAGEADVTTFLETFERLAGGLPEPGC